MPLFTLHRNYILRTMKGHTIGFKEGIPTNVPDICIEDAVAIGAQPVEGEVDVLGEEEKAQPPLTADEREAKVFEAFRTMKARNERNDFTASGLPSNKRLPALLNFELTNAERDAYWQKFREQEQETVDQAKLDRAVEAAENDGES